MSQERSNNKLQNNAKLFITNLPPGIQQNQLKDELQRLFEVYGRILHLNVKKNKNGQYSFAFLQFQNYEDAHKAIGQMDQKEIHERPMKVRQDRQMQGCFNCKREGHFAKECPERQDREGYRRRSPRRDHERRHNSRRSRSHDKYHRERSRSYQNHRRHREPRRQRYYRERSNSRDYDRHRGDYSKKYYKRDRYDDNKDYDRYKSHRRQRYSRSRSYSSGR